MTQARKVLGAAYYYGESPAKKKPIIIARGIKMGYEGTKGGDVMGEKYLDDVQGGHP